MIILSKGFMWTFIYEQLTHLFHLSHNSFVTNKHAHTDTYKTYIIHVLSVLCIVRPRALVKTHRSKYFYPSISSPK